MPAILYSYQRSFCSYGKQNTSNILQIPPKSKGVKPNNEKIDWDFAMVGMFTFLHVVALRGLYLCFTSAKIATIVFGEYNDLI